MAADMDPGVCLMSRKPWGRKARYSASGKPNRKLGWETWQHSATVWKPCFSVCGYIKEFGMERKGVPPGKNVFKAYEPS